MLFQAPLQFGLPGYNFYVTLGTSNYLCAKNRCFVLNPKENYKFVANFNNCSNFSAQVVPTHIFYNYYVRIFK